MCGAPVLRPPVRACAQETTFGGDDQVLRIGVERLGDERLTHFWSVGVSRIDQIYPQFEGAAQDSDGFLLIGWWSPDTRARQAHGSEAEAIDRQVSATREGSAFCSGLLS